VFVFALTSAASAQDYHRQQARAADQAYEAASGSISARAAAVRQGAQAARDRSRALEAALTAMNDGPEAGGKVVAYLNDRKVEVSFADQAEAAKTAVVDGRTVIVLSSSLPAHPRVYAALIASEAAKGMFADMPACAERAYMISATAARAFTELGGEMKTLPVVDGDTVVAVGAAVAAWDADAQTALYALSRLEGVDELPALAEAAKDPKTRAALDAANRRFTAFLLDEREARASAR
jgi:hypothetical protein